MEIDEFSGVKIESIDFSDIPQNAVKFSLDSSLEEYSLVLDLLKEIKECYKFDGKNKQTTQRCVS